MLRIVTIEHQYLKKINLEHHFIHPKIAARFRLKVQYYDKRYT